MRDSICRIGFSPECPYVGNRPNRERHVRPGDVSRSAASTDDNSLELKFRTAAQGGATSVQRAVKSFCLRDCDSKGAELSDH